MRMSEGVEWGIHCCTVLAVLPTGATLPASRLAEYHGVPAAYLAKHMQALSKAGIVESVAGPKGGYRLAKPPAEITVLDVVLAIEGAEPAFHCDEIRRRGPAALPSREYKTACGITKVMRRAEAAWREELRSTTLGDLVITVTTTVPQKALEKGARWLSEVVR